MKKIIYFNIIFILLFSILSCSDNSVNEDDPGPLRDLTDSEKKLVESDNNFGLKLFRKVIEYETEKNVFISPLSVSMALGMAYNGAKGDTREAMQATMELTGLSIQEVNESYKSLIELLSGLDQSVIFNIANSIWHRQGLIFSEDFINLNKIYFNAEVNELDFSLPNAADIINQWVSDNTNEKITKIVTPPIPPEIVMYLINAIYFKGDWSAKFDEEFTFDDTFILPDDSEIQCKMMTRNGDFQYYENDDFQAIDLPYGDGNFTMLIFLPKNGNDVDSLIADLTKNNWEQWLNNFSERSGDIYIPKFTMEYEIKLNDVLSALGMEIAFDPVKADFTGMMESGGLYIDEAKHKTFVKVNEEGTEAAAVTSIGATTALPETLIRVNRPFVFAIRESHSNTILFIGKIIKPECE